MHLFRLLKSSVQNDLFLACVTILNQAKIKYTQSTLMDLLKQHIDYPSLLSINDVLGDYGIQSAAIRKGEYTYEDFETPFICSIQKEGWANARFTVVDKVDERNIRYLDSETNQFVESSLSDFEKIDKQVILLIDSDSAKDELDYKENVQKERLDNFIRLIPRYLFLVIAVIAIVYQFSSESTLFSWINSLFLITSLSGTFLSYLLLVHEVDEHDPFVKEVCGMMGRKSGCTKVLSSQWSNLLGISWSILGAVYFGTFFISMIFFSRHPSNLIFWSLMSLLISPYIIFSVYYQWRVVKQWCPLCLSIQVMILLSAIGGFAYFTTASFLLKTIYSYHFILVLFIGIFLFLLTYNFMPILKRANDSEQYKMKWRKIRYNPQIFDLLLQQNMEPILPTDGIGVVIGNEHAMNEIIKVCNPYCDPCSEAHPELESIIRRNPDVKLRIIFTASGEESDIRTAPVSHLLAIQEKYGSTILSNALDDWYSSVEKSYENFAEKYPMNDEPYLQKEKIFAMRDWCEKMKIRATPTLYINGLELPEGYSAKDLKYFF